MPRKVALTGATGFIGYTLVKALARDGWHIQALTRNKRSNEDNVTWIPGTLDNVNSLQKLVDGSEAVIHCAGRVRGKNSEEFNHTNAVGTENIIRVASSQKPQPKFLLISSLAAREPQLSWYANSKYLAENAVVNLSGVMPWTIFRPTAVYGPGDRELSPLFRSTRLGILPAAGIKPGRFSLLHVDDLVSAVLAWLNTDKNVRGMYELDDGTPGGYDYRQLAATASQVWNHPVFILPLPIPLLYVIAFINLCLARFIRYSPMLTPGKVREIKYPDWVCDTTPLTRALNWKPKVNLRDAMAASILPAQKA